MTTRRQQLAQRALGVLTAWETSEEAKAANEDMPAAFASKHIDSLKAGGVTERQLLQGLLVVAHDLVHECPNGEVLKRLGTDYASESPFTGGVVNGV